MDLGPRSLAVVLAAVACGALTVPDAAALAHHPSSRRLALALWLRRTLARTLGLGLIGVGLVELSSCAGGLVWYDLDRFLQRQATVPTVATVAWHTASLKVVVGLAWSAVAFEPFVATMLGLLLAFVPLSAWWITTRQMPLQPGHSAWLLGLALWAALPAAAMAAVSGLRPWPSCPPLPRGLGRAGATAVVVMAVAAPWASGSCSGSLWATLLCSAAGLSLTLVLLVAGRDGWRQEHPPPQANLWGVLGSFAVALIHGNRAAWVTGVGVLCLWHATLLSAGWPLALRDGRQVIDRITAWPQLLTGREEPVEADWQDVATRLRQTVQLYEPHPWCGRYLLLVGWIEGTRLRQPTRARLTLTEAADRWPRVRATAPPGWPAEHTIGRIVRRLLDTWGPLLDPGMRPA